MLHLVDGKIVYIVTFKTLPVLPITGVGVEQYYAEALTTALRDGTIREPGKYGIEIDWVANEWNVYKVNE